MPPAHDQIAHVAMEAIESRSPPAWVDWVVTIVFATAATASMLAWLYVLCLVLWDSAIWLLS